MFRKKERKKARVSDNPLPEWFYDSDYYKNPGIKSNWSEAYEWQYFRQLMMAWWDFLFYMFLEKKSFLDVGCATGLLERGFLESRKMYDFPKDSTIEGFDYSSWAIANADSVVRDMVSQASVDDYKFERNYDMMLSLDVFGHLTEKQARDFLVRSRKHVNDCLLFVIEFDEPHQWKELSHINLQNREWWHELFIECGWVRNRKGEIFKNEYEMMERFAMRNRFIRLNKLQVFIYGAGNYV